MNKEALEAFAREASKRIKTEQDFHDFSADDDQSNGGACAKYRA